MDKIEIQCTWSLSKFGHLKQGYFSLAEYIDKATTLCNQFEYPPEACDQLLRDAIVIGLQSTTRGSRDRQSGAKRDRQQCSTDRKQRKSEKNLNYGGRPAHPRSAPQRRLSASSEGKTGITVL